MTLRKVSFRSVNPLLWHSLVFGLIKDFDANRDNKVSFGEFVSALWTLEKRDEENELAAAQGDEPTQDSIVIDAPSRTEAERSQESAAQTRSLSELKPPEVERYLLLQQQKYLKEFGAMMPTHVHCMPGQTALKFLK